MRYGTVPIVRETGGLRDTVLSYNKFTDEGNGFSFFNYNAHDMLHTVRRAVHYYKNNKDVWNKLIVRGMSGDYSWTASAGKYMALYEKLVVPFEEPAAQEAPAAQEVKAEEVKTEETKPAKKAPAKRAPRKKAEAAPVAEVKAEEAPAKPKRAPRKKKAEEAPAAEVKADEAPAKPKRASRKKKTEEVKAE